MIVPFVTIAGHPSVLYIVLYLGVDVYRFVFEDLWVWLKLDESNLLLTTLDKILRLLITYFSVTEGIRTLSLLIFMLLIPAKLIKLSGDLLLKQSQTFV